MRGGREHAWKRAALLLAAGAAAAGGCAWAVQGKLTTAWYEVPLPAGLEGLDGVKIAQISDVHSADLERPLGAALAAAAPDLIVMTGDLVNREDRELSRASDWLRVGYFYDSYPTSPRLFPGVVARREECRAEFTIPDSGLASTEPLHLYLFFSRQDKVAFSESTYLRV